MALRLDLEDQAHTTLAVAMNSGRRSNTGERYDRNRLRPVKPRDPASRLGIALGSDIEPKPSTSQSPNQACRVGPFRRDGEYPRARKCSDQLRKALSRAKAAISPPQGSPSTSPLLTHTRRELISPPRTTTSTRSRTSRKLIHVLKNANQPRRSRELVSEGVGPSRWRVERSPTTSDPGHDVHGRIPGHRQARPARHGLGLPETQRRGAQPLRDASPSGRRQMTPSRGLLGALRSRRIRLRYSPAHLLRLHHDAKCPSTCPLGVATHDPGLLNMFPGNQARHHYFFYVAEEAWLRARLDPPLQRSIGLSDPPHTKKGIEPEGAASTSAASSTAQSSPSPRATPPAEPVARKSLDHR